MMAFVDIETSPVYPDTSLIPEETLELYRKKFSHEFGEEYLAAEIHYEEKAAFYAEFGQIVCISIGFLKDDQLRVKSIVDTDEKRLLNVFVSLLGKVTSMVAHNGKEFDSPFLCRKLIIHDIKLPDVLSIIGKKPWDVNLFDTMEFWKFTSYKHTISLDLLCHVLGVKSPKKDMTGDQVAAYFHDGKLKEIGEYCAGDVVALVHCYQRIKQIPITTQIEIVQ